MSQFFLQHQELFHPYILKISQQESTKLGHTTHLSGPSTCCRHGQIHWISSPLNHEACFSLEYNKKKHFRGCTSVYLLWNCSSLLGNSLIRDFIQSLFHILMIARKSNDEQGVFSFSLLLRLVQQTEHSTNSFLYDKQTILSLGKH